MTWLARTPIAVVMACVVMMGRLRARESIASSQQIAVGSGSMEGEARERQLGEWERAAYPAPRGQPVNVAALSAIGIGVRMVNRGQ